MYNYLCNQCLSPLKLWVWILFMVRCNRFDTTLCDKVCQWLDTTLCDKVCQWLDTTLCDKVCQWLVTGRWFSLSTLVSSTNKTVRHDITEILLKVAVNTITLTLKTKWNFPLPCTTDPKNWHNAIVFLHSLMQCTEIIKKEHRKVQIYILYVRAIS